MLPIFIEGTNDSEYTIACCDEVGRGPGAGPVTAACVIWDPNYEPSCVQDEKLLNMIKDSKKITEKNREKLEVFIKNNAVDYGICSIDNKTIDEINILQASFKAMHGALDQLTTDFDKIYVDGNRFKTYMNPRGDFVPHTCIVKGDDTLFGVAAASILAKTHRDRLLVEIHNSNEAFHPYAWDKNKGYLTSTHIEAIKQHGLTEHHRKSFIKNSWLPNR